MKGISIPVKLPGGAFRRSKGTRNCIPDEIIGLREKIANARRELLDLQAGFWYGPTNSQTATLQITGAHNHSILSEAQAAFRHYVSARDQLLFTFGPTGQEVQTKGTLAFAANAFMAALGQKNPRSG